MSMLSAASESGGTTDSAWHIVGIPDALWDVLPVAVYVCDQNGLILRYNNRAAELWGRRPNIADPVDRFCGSHRLYRIDGASLPHAECPMADVLRSGIPVRDHEVVVERPDGSRIVALVNIEPLRNDAGMVVGAVNCFQDITERKLVEGELRSSRAILHEREQWSRELLEALPAAIYTTDAEGRITFYNRAAADLWGRQPELGKNEWCGSWRLYWPDGRPMAHDECPMARALKEGTAIRGAEAVAQRPDGTRVPFIAYPTPIRDVSGNVVGAVNMLVDITERKRVDALLEEQANRLFSIFAQASAGIAETDVSGRFLMVNDRYSAITGRSREELLQLRMHDITHPDDLIENAPLFARTVEHAEPFGIEKRYVRPDGSWAWVHNSVFAVKGATGRVERLTAVCVDINDRKHGEVAAQRLSSIVDSSNDAIVSKDLDGIVITWNKGAERIFGYAAEDMIGKPIMTIIPPHLQEEETTILQRIRRGEHIDHFETIRRRKDGSLVDISLTVSPIKNAAGRVIGASKVARDISDRKRAEEQRNLLLREMSHRVKNLFGVTSSVVALTARSASSTEEMAKAIRDRLSALSRAHELTQSGLIDSETNENRRTTFHALVRTIFAPYAGEADSAEHERVVIHGPDVPISEHAVASLSLVIHEFATNAAKYGALSSITGRVEIDCSLEQDEFLLTWQEHDGPPVSGPPEYEGFGRLLTRRIITGQFGGRLSEDWKPEGLRIHLSIAVERLTT